MLGFGEALKRQAGARALTPDYRERTVSVAWGKERKFDYDALKKSVSESPNLTFWSLTIAARGEVVTPDGKPAFKVAETNELFLLDLKRKGSASAKLIEAAKPGKRLTVTGRVTKSKHDGKESLWLAVERFEPCAE